MTLSNKNMNILRDFLIVGCGSFLGGGSRFLVSKLVGGLFATSFPVATFIVNLLGCLLIGFVSSLPSTLSWLSLQARLLLTTGFCGGLTTFSTFMNENLRWPRPKLSLLIRLPCWQFRPWPYLRMGWWSLGQGRCHVIAWQPYPLSFA